MKRLKYILLCALLACSSLVGAQVKNGQNKVELKGMVVDASNGNPLPGMSVTLPGVAAAMTDDKGEFMIKLPSSKEGLEISGPMRELQKVSVKGRAFIKIKMYEDGYLNSSYKDVLTPIGDINHTQMTGSATYLSNDNSINPAYTPEQLLQGTVAGLNTQMRSGQDGTGANMYLHGINSIYANNQPLLVVDGMVVENQAFGTSLIDGYVSTPLGSIDVRDIQRMTVLKDATALYGVKGSNGAIIIETLRSKEMVTKITARALFGVNLTPNKIPLLNADEAKSYLIDLYQSQGLTASTIQSNALFNTTLPTKNKWGVWSGNTDYYRYNKSTDWQDQLFQNSIKSQYGLNVTGGDNVAVYALSLGFINNNGLIKGTSYNRFNARVNGDINISPKLNIRTNMSFLYGQKQLRDEASTSSTNPLYSSLIKAPFMTSHVYDESDLPSPNLEDKDVFGFSNPLAITENVNEKNSNYRFMGNVEVLFQLNKYLKLSTNFGLNFNKEREFIFYPSTGIAYPSVSDTEVINSSRSRVERLFSLFDETRITYNHKFDAGHKLDAIVGFRYMSTHSEEDWGKAYNSASDKLTTLSSGDNMLRQTGGSLGDWKWMAIFANANYDLFNKYFFTATTSFDASSRYGTKTANFQAFPSLQVAWLISSEDFMKKVEAVNLLKLRVGYTYSGNDDLGNYAGRRYYTSQNYYGNYGLVRGNLVDENLKPELSKKLNFGLDVAFFNDLLSFSFDYYINNISHLLTYGDAPNISGFSTYVTNGGSMKNSGLDIAVKGRIINSALTWDLGVNATFNKNKVTKLIQGNYTTTAYSGNIRTAVGAPMGQFYGYKTNGVYSTTAEANAAGLYTLIGTKKTAFQAGDVRFVNVNGDSDGLIDKNDMTVIGDPNPDVFGGITSTLKWRRFTLNALFTYSVGNDVYNYTRCVLESQSGYENQTQAVLNRWSVEGQNTSMPKVSYGDPRGNSRFSDRWIEDGSYLKFKTLSFSYDLPIKSGFFAGVTVYGATENLFTLTRYKGYDPEVANSLNPLTNGIDAFITPTVRTFYFGVKIGL